MTTKQERKLLTAGDLTDSQERTIDALYGGNVLAICAKGHGKTVCGQAAAQELLHDDVLNRVLVIAPLKVATLSWRNEHLSWNFLEEPAMAIGDEGERLWAINDTAEIVVTNYESLVWLFESGEYRSFDGLLLDETSRLGSVGSKGVKTLRKYRNHFAWIAGLSASPVAEHGRMIYSQALIIDGGKALGTRQDKFLQTYMYPTDFQQRRYAFQPGAEARLAEALKDMVYVADDREYEESLPELRDEIVHVEQGPEAWTAYEQMCNEMFIDVGEVEAASQGVVSGKLLQITSGSYYDKSHNVHDLHHAKYDALHALIGQAEGPVAVCYAFKYQLTELMLMYPHMRILGNDPEGVERDWNAGKISLMGLHAKSASHGLNLQYGGHELIVLTPIWSADQQEQLLGRFRRRGQRSSYVRRTTIVVPGTIDELILDRQLGKAQDERSLMGHIRNVARIEK